MGASESWGKTHLNSSPDPNENAWHYPENEESSAVDHVVVVVLLLTMVAQLQEWPHVQLDASRNAVLQEEVQQGVLQGLHPWAVEVARWCAGNQDQVVAHYMHYCVAGRAIACRH